MNALVAYLISRSSGKGKLARCFFEVTPFLCGVEGKSLRNRIHFWGFPRNFERDPRVISASMLD